jgi:DNA-binding transcriptional ArsR family regulator
MMYSPTDDLRDLRAILASRTLSMRARLVAVVLLSYRRSSDGRCDPGIERIAADAGVDARTVRRSLLELTADGVVECDYRRGRSTQYALRTQTAPLTNLSGVTETQEVQICQDTPGKSVTKPLANLSPKRTKNERKNERSEIVDRLWAAFVEAMNGADLKLTATRQQKLGELYDEHLKAAPDPLALFGSILNVVKADDFRMKTRAYHMPESLFKNAERREARAMDGRNRMNGHQSNGRSRNPMVMTTQELREWEATR